MKRMVYQLWICFLKTLFYAFRIFPIDNNKIVLSSYGGKGFGDNSKYIALKLHEINPNVKLYWVVKNTSYEFPEWITKVKLNSIKFVYEMVTAKIWVDNSRKPLYIRKRNGQQYIQTWHGGIGLKRCEGDTVEPLPEEWILTSKHDSEMIDLMVSNSTFCTEMYKRAFWYKGEIMEAGSPRCDVLVNCSEETKKHIRKELSIDSDKLIILYAPTFRSNEAIDAYDIDVEKVLKSYNERTKKEAVFLLRFHPLTNPANYRISFSKKVVDVTDYPDMYELMSVADVLITDYSSTMMEFMFAKKEVQLYVKDYDEYSKERGCWFSLEDLPFTLSKTNEQLLHAIESFDHRAYMSRIDAFKKKVNLKEDGTASEKVAKVINEIISNGEKKKK